MQAKPIAGVNLGGWLVLERWITPSLFASTPAVDEYSFCLHATPALQRRLKKFRETFITEQDFAWLANQGITAIRLPVGYWLFGDSAPYQSTVHFVDKAFAWASKYNLRILLDLHGAPGSQNGKDHSGQKGRGQWHSNDQYITATLAVIAKLAERYGQNRALLGISLLNEPSSNIPKATLLHYYRAAYDSIRSRCGNEVWIVYSDAYAPRRWRKELRGGTFKNVYIDTHQYQVFAPADKISSRLNLLRTRWRLPAKLKRLEQYHPAIIGEWSLALGGRDLAGYTPMERQAIVRRYGQLQLQAYQHTAAWFFWTYQTENGGPWNFRDCVAKGLLGIHQ